MKKSIRILIIIAAVVILLIACLPLANRLIYHRSLSATLFAMQLNKEEYPGDYAFSEMLLEKSQENSERYLYSGDAGITVSHTVGMYEDMQYYVLNKGASQLAVYFPGGSYIDQPRSVHWQFLNQLAQDTDTTFIVPLYPKLPDNDAEASYAVMSDFCESVVKSMAVGYDRLVFMGDSAGGSYALSFAMQQRDAGLTVPDSMILICPWVDVSLSNDEIPRYEKHDPALDSTMLRELGVLWAGDLDVCDPIISPLYGDLSGLCPITLFTTKGELLYPDISLMHDKLVEAGNDCTYYEGEGIFHVWPLYFKFGIPESEEGYAQVAAALSE